MVIKISQKHEFPETVVDQVYKAIKKRICGGDYLPGMHLVEADMTKEFNVSRVTVRDALRRLTIDGLVEFIPNRGIRVHQLSYKDVMDIYTVRESLEGLSARLAAEKPKEALLTLREVLESEEKTEPNAIIQQIRLNIIFHAAIARISENHVLISTLERLNTQLIAFQFLKLVGRLDVDNTLKYHRQIVNAIQEGNADGAEFLMRAHIQKTKEIVKDAFPEDSFHFDFQK